ncbi:MAG: prepilin-type N-terminal cleavage/methylation domain-containing protein [Oscillospiraceae bacterium]|nr:prepilin-type N-terminal cleavage/methylation domain-containing protein [Oscillospiraceae bacterium]
MNVKNLKSNKGFSLIELLVSFAIFGVLCAALVGFITMSSRSYRRTSDMVNLQIEYQIVMNMLSEFVMGCNGSIAFNADTGTLTINDGDGTVNTFALDDGGLFLNGNIVSRNVTAFTAVRETGDNLLGITMSFSPTNPGDSRVYTAEQLINLRNSPDTLGVPERPAEPEEEDNDDEE